MTEFNNELEVTNREVLVREFDQQLARTVEKLRTMNLHKLERQEFATKFYALTQDLADASLRDSGQLSIQVPHLNPTTFADQLLVLGMELFKGGNTRSLSALTERLLKFRKSL